jgi:hypothetical protein
MADHSKGILNACCKVSNRVGTRIGLGCPTMWFCPGGLVGVDPSIPPSLQWPKSVRCGKLARSKPFRSFARQRTVAGDDR